MSSTIGLVFYAALTLTGFVGLLWDWVREEHGEQTFTAWFTAKTWRTVAAVVVVFLGPTGFALHLLTFTN